MAKKNYTIVERKDLKSFEVTFASKLSDKSRELIIADCSVGGGAFRGLSSTKYCIRLGQRTKYGKTNDFKTVKEMEAWIKKNITLAETTEEPKENKEAKPKAKEIKKANKDSAESKVDTNAIVEALKAMLPDLISKEVQGQLANIVNEYAESVEEA